MPTARGWLVAFVGAILVGAGLAFGSPAIEQLGAALVGLVVIAVAVVRLGRHEISVTRKLPVRRVAAGQSLTVSLELANEGRGSAPLLLIEDRLPPGVAGQARFAVNGVEARGQRDAGYELLPSRRGRYTVGPLEIAFVDPFTLARLRVRSAGTEPILVHPRIEPLALPRDLGERRSLSASALRQPTGASGEDFYTLREYIEGDDLRKIHWPSTAKRERFMIRQEETPWHTRSCIVLDDVAGDGDRAGELAAFERMVEAAASVVDLYHRSGYSYRLTPARHAGLPPGRGSDHLHRCLDLLATISQGEGEPHTLPARLVELETGTRAEGTLVLVTGTLTAKSIAAIARCRRRFRDVIAVVVPSHRFGAAATRARWEGERRTVEMVRLLARSGARAVVLGPGEPLAAGWESLSRPRWQPGEQAWDRKPELV